MTGGRTRMEKDSMGEMSLPESALYGASTQRAVLNFPVSGYRFSRAFIRALGLIKWAVCRNLSDGKKMFSAPVSVPSPPGRRQRDCYVVAQLRFKLRSSLRKKLPTRRARF